MYGCMKTYNADYMVYEDCERLLRDDCNIKETKYNIREAFALCKMTVVNETEHQGELQYMKLEYVEFLEFLARITELHF